ncbi:MAG: histidine phosphatase family protein [Solobacterium sp.]|nr:histidine phosphatase family protein [Solobacterium sp.]
MKVTFYYTRHGKTEYNRLGIMQGQLDSPLTEEGKQGLQKTTEVLKEVPFNRCFSSSLGRAMDSAKILLGDRDLPVVPLDDLMEMDFGSLDGKPSRKHLIPIIFMHMIGSFHAVGGESTQDMVTRSGRAFQTMVDQCEDGDQVLVVSHGSFYRYALRALTGKNIFNKKVVMSNGDVSVITYEDGVYRLVCYPCQGEELNQVIRSLKK